MHRACMHAGTNLVRQKGGFFLLPSSYGKRKRQAEICCMHGIKPTAAAIIIKIRGSHFIYFNPFVRVSTKNIESPVASNQDPFLMQANLVNHIKAYVCIQSLSII